MQVSYAPFAPLGIPNVSVCLAFWLNYYIAACGALGVPLLGEKLFRSSEHKKVCVTSSVWRVSRICTTLKVSHGETPHSFRGLAEHRNCLLLHAPLQCFYLFAVDRTGYTQSHFCGLSTRPATLRPREFAENFV